ncbi:MAG TPA: MazG nucleotide pyrophosphohydrolase domain-containing protein [Candidatus Thermoplasmatota archaeon]|nr:MazG nucleotide pyrophosphohydrolase domain-containing protein [Candidatus Thermoplasmatota archaeon]
MELSAIQRAVAERTLAGDREMGVGFLAMVLAEETGEVAEAARKGDLAHAGKEAVDVAFMALAIANLAGVDVEGALRAKFLDRPMEDVAKSWTDVTWKDR